MSGRRGGYEPGMNRRALLRAGALASLYTLIGRPRPALAAGLGPLVERGLPLALPEGFTATVIDRAGEPMSDGFVVPGHPDGMACTLGPQGEHVLLRNHELAAQAAKGAYPEGAAPPQALRPDRFGAVTRVVVDAQSGARRRSNLVLTGTENNCCGGPTPWGWVSCEETDSPGHGYAYLCPWDAASVQAPQRLAAWGRFRREAIALLPDGSVIQTEDHPQGALYRFVPEGGRDRGALYALGIVGQPGLDTTHVLGPRVHVATTWVRVPDPDATQTPCREQARALGAATFCRGEGVVLDGRRAVFTATQGGALGIGQVWAVDVGAGTLALLAEASDPAHLHMPDNVTVAPWGDLILCEDGPDVDHLRGLTPSGELYTLARNTSSPHELAGVCFSPDGLALYVNLQKDGLTLRVTGPWPRMR